MIFVNVVGLVVKVFSKVRQLPESWHEQICGHSYASKECKHVYFMQVSPGSTPKAPDGGVTPLDAKALFCSSAKQVIHKQQQHE